MAKREKGKDQENRNPKPSSSNLTVVQENWLWTPAGTGSRNIVELAKSYCVAFTGYRGAGKTFSLAYIGAKALAANMTVFANFTIEFILQRETGKKEYKKALPLDMDALYRFDEGIQNAVVLIMEMQNFVPTRRTMTLRNILFNAIVQQMRHRSLSLFYDCKHLGLVDNQVQWETDVEILCRDAFHTGWGTEHEVAEPGELIFWYPTDLSGLWTHSLQPKRCGHRHVYVKPLRGIYNTEQNIDFLETMAPVKMGLEPRIIGGNGGGIETFEFTDQDRNKIAAIFRTKDRAWLKELTAKLDIPSRGPEKEALERLLFNMGYDMGQSGGNTYYQKGKVIA